MTTSVMILGSAPKNLKKDGEKNERWTSIVGLEWLTDSASKHPILAQSSNATSTMEQQWRQRNK